MAEGEEESVKVAVRVRPFISFQDIFTLYVFNSSRLYLNRFLTRVYVIVRSQSYTKIAIINVLNILMINISSIFSFIIGNGKPNFI